jgi:antitoxin ParD1/3/4
MTFRLVLDRQSEEFIQRMIESQRYEHASDVVLDALRLLEDQEKLRELKRAELFAKIDEGIASADRGELTDADEVFAELDAMIERKARGDQDAA